jgi:hypothetical protein
MRLWTFLCPLIFLCANCHMFRLNEAVPKVNLWIYPYHVGRLVRWGTVRAAFIDAERMHAMLYNGS